MLPAVHASLLDSAVDPVVTAVVGAIGGFLVAPIRARARRKQARSILAAWAYDVIRASNELLHLSEYRRHNPGKPPPTMEAPTFPSSEISAVTPLVDRRVRYLAGELDAQLRAVRWLLQGDELPSAEDIRHRIATVGWYQGRLVAALQQPLKLREFWTPSHSTPPQDLDRPERWSPGAFMDAGPSTET